jgi:hypothetical protein
MKDYSVSATAFVTKFVVGTKLHLPDLERFATEITSGTNGFQIDRTLAPALAEPDDERRGWVIRKALNRGGEKSSPRFFLKTEDAREGRMVVQALEEKWMDDASPSKMLTKASAAAYKAKKARLGLDKIDTEDMSEADVASLDIRKQAGDEYVQRETTVVREFGDSLRTIVLKQIGVPDSVVPKLLSNMTDLETISKATKRLES